MRYLTDRKRAQGLGASGSGTHHHWQMMVSSMLMLPAVPLFIFIVGAGMGGTYDEVVAYFSRPCIAILTGLSLTVILNHLKNEAHEAIEDYMHGVSEKVALVAASAFSYTLIVAGIYSLITIAL